MTNIYDYNSNIDFSNFELEFPTLEKDSYYFSKIKYLGEKFTIQPPNTLTKDGVNTSKNKKFIDLKYDTNNNNENTLLLNIFGNIEKNCKKLILEKKKDWFQDSIDENSLDEMFISPLKLYLSGKYSLLRVYLDNDFNCFDEKQNMLSEDYVIDNRKIIPLIEINGIVFNSEKFHIDIKCSQMMVLNDENKAKCLIKLKNDENSLEESETNNSNLNNILYN